MRNEIEKAIEDLKVLYENANILSVNTIREKLKNTISALEKQKSSGWIPCKERLPEEYGCYLVAWRPVSLTAEDVVKKTGIVPHYYEIVEYDPDDEALWIGGIEQCKEYEIFAWQPLPESFKGGRK